MTAPAPQKPEPEEQKARARMLGWLVLAIIVAYGGFQLPLPWKLLTVVAGLAGVAGAGVLLVLCVRRSLPPLIWLSAMLTLACCGLFVVLGTMQAVFWDASATFDHCRDTAVTERAMQQCISDYEEDMLSQLPGAG